MRVNCHSADDIIEITLAHTLEDHYLNTEAYNSTISK